MIVRDKQPMTPQLNEGLQAHDHQPNAVDAAEQMTLGFAMLFFGVGAVQQYIAVWFQERGTPETGKTVLVLVYLFYFLGSFQAHRVVRHFGSRLCMCSTSLIYGLLVLSIWSGNEYLSYLSATLSGLAASTLWTGQNVVLNQISDGTLRSRAVSNFWTRYPLGTGVGTLILGLLIGQFSYSTPVMGYAIITVCSAILFWKMPIDRALAISSSGAAHSKLPTFDHATLGCAATVFFVRFVYGLIISQVPIDLKETIGSGYVGLVTSPFFVLPVIVSKPLTAFANSRGITLTAGMGYSVALIGIALLLLPLDGFRLVSSVALVALSSAILNPIGNLLPKRLSELTGVELTRIAGTFSLAGSSGILMGLLSVTVLSRSAAYGVAIGALFVALISLMIVWRVIVRGAES